MRPNIESQFLPSPSTLSTVFFSKEGTSVLLVQPTQKQVDLFQKRRLESKRSVFFERRRWEKVYLGFQAAVE